MRSLLSQLLVDAAKQNPEFVVLSGDHGYALFDQLRKEKESQFINVGVAEQLAVSLASGLAKTGHRPVVYGLASFIPLRVLEQIKLDVCFSKLPVIFLGDGAGLVYSTLGVSHQCGEDIACLRALPHLAIYSPADAYELSICFAEAMGARGPSYIRLGKSDRALTHDRVPGSSEPHWVHELTNCISATCLIATGSMLAPAKEAAKRAGIPCLSIPRLKPFSKQIGELIRPYSRIIVAEEHSRYGGLASSLLDALVEQGCAIPAMDVLALKDEFTDLCGNYQFALSEHDLSDVQFAQRVQALLTRQG